jgi:predicted ferric reductase
MTVPVLAVMSYFFQFHQYTSINTIILISAFVLLFFFVGGLLYLLITKEHYERKLKPSYQREFTLLMSVSALGIFGIGILFIYFGGNPFYFPHVIIPIAIVAYALSYFVGRKYFNVWLIKN